MRTEEILARHGLSFCGMGNIPIISNGEWNDDFSERLPIAPQWDKGEGDYAFVVDDLTDEEWVAGLQHVQIMGYYPDPGLYLVKRN